MRFVKERSICTVDYWLQSRLIIQATIGDSTEFSNT